MNWEQSAKELTELLSLIEVTDRDGRNLDIDEGYRRLVESVAACLPEKRRVYFVGNGASASMASHYSADLAKMSGVPTEVFTDPALITATGNDFGYEESFSFPLSQRVVPGEVLIAISSSGNSPNAVNAVKKVQEMGGLAVTFTGMSKENTMRGLGDLNFYIPGTTYGQVESAHAIMLHHLVDIFTEDGESSP